MNLVPAWLWCWLGFCLGVVLTMFVMVAVGYHR